MNFRRSNKDLSIARVPCAPFGSSQLPKAINLIDGPARHGSLRWDEASLAFCPVGLQNIEST